MVDVLVKYGCASLEGASEFLDYEVGLPWCEDSGGLLVVGTAKAFKESWAILYPLLQPYGGGSWGDVWEE